MVYIDPKDQPSHPDWPHAYKAAWEERRMARMERCKLDKKLADLDVFMTMFERLDGHPKPQVPSQVTTTTVICQCINGALNDECPIHGSSRMYASQMA